MIFTGYYCTQYPLIEQLRGSGLRVDRNSDDKERNVDYMLWLTINDLINTHSQINAPYLIDAPLEVYSLY